MPREGESFAYIFIGSVIIGFGFGFCAGMGVFFISCGIAVRISDE